MFNLGLFLILWVFAHVLGVWTADHAYVSEYKSYIQAFLVLSYAVVDWLLLADVMGAGDIFHDY